jgi:hypothetical protein
MNIWSENLKGKNHFGNLGVDERIMLRYAFNKWVVNLWSGNK